MNINVIGNNKWALDRFLHPRASLYLLEDVMIKTYQFELLDGCIMDQSAILRIISAIGVEVRVVFIKIGVSELYYQP